MRKTSKRSKLAAESLLSEHYGNPKDAIDEAQTMRKQASGKHRKFWVETIAAIEQLSQGAQS